MNALRIRNVGSLDLRPTTPPVISFPDGDVFNFRLYPNKPEAWLNHTTHHANIAIKRHGQGVRQAVGRRAGYPDRSRRLIAKLPPELQTVFSLLAKNVTRLVGVEIVADGEGRYLDVSLWTSEKIDRPTAYLLSLRSRINRWLLIEKQRMII